MKRKIWAVKVRLRRELGLGYTEGIDVGRGSFGIVKFWVVLPDRRCKRQDSARRDILEPGIRAAAVAPSLFRNSAMSKDEALVFELCVFVGRFGL